ncbi:MAG: molecular chaperone HtpG [Alphaproteobacteria bacterium]
MAEESFGFQAEVSKLLDIVANSLYSNKAVFLRELISNSSDACDRLRYAALTQPELVKEDPDLKVTLSIDAPARTITIADNGIGMNREDLVENLGTIARSGTAAFMDQLTGDKGTDMALIGQFGIGFYSAFMVAERVDVLTHKAGEQRGWRWRSCGKGEFTIAAVPQAARGTAVTLHLRKGEDEFLDPGRIRRIVQTYSDHIPLPIVLKGAPGKDGEEQGGEETLNAASALWVRPKSEITPDQYKEFYHHVGHAFDDPWLTLHTKVEGVIAYTSLLFVPSVRPIDLFHPDRKHRIKLYVRRVFVTDDCEGLMPSYLRFVRGIVDSEDLPLNISREMLQHNPVVGKIRSGLVKRILDGLKKRADNDGEDYAKFWDSFGAVLKEGIYEDSARRDELLELSRFRSTAGAGLVSLSEYVARMAEGQDAIFHITGEERDSLAASPQIEGLKARGVEVLLLTDPVDDFWVPAVGDFQGKPFRSATKGGVTLDKIKPREGAHEEPEEGAAEPPAAAPGLDALIALLKEALKGAVKDVRVSERLTESPVCLVADEGDMDMHLERMLMQHQRVAVCSPRILEINPSHELIRRLAAAAAAKGEAAACQTLADAPHLLLDQARIVEGEPLPDPGAFSRRLARVMERGLPEGDSNR